MAVSTKVEPINEAFQALNSFKRHRTLKDVKPATQDKHFHELQMFKQFDKIELALRAIQKAVRMGDLDIHEEEEDADEETSS